MGGELAFRWATNFGTSSDFKAPNAGFFDIAYMIKLGAGGGGGVILGIFPFSHPADTGGDFVSIEVSGGHPEAQGGFGAGIELVFSVPKGQHKLDMSKWKFEGVQLPIGGGASPLPGEINFKVGTGIQLGG